MSKKSPIYWLEVLGLQVGDRYYLADWVQKFSFDVIDIREFDTYIISLDILDSYFPHVPDENRVEVTGLIQIAVDAYKYVKIQEPVRKYSNIPPVPLEHSDTIPPN